MNLWKLVVLRMIYVKELGSKHAVIDGTCVCVCVFTVISANPIRDLSLDLRIAFCGLSKHRIIRGLTFASKSSRPNPLGHRRLLRTRRCPRRVPNKINIFKTCSYPHLFSSSSLGWGNWNKRLSFHPLNSHDRTRGCGLGQSNDLWMSNHLFLHNVIASSTFSLMSTRNFPYCSFCRVNHERLYLLIAWPVPHVLYKVILFLKATSRLIDFVYNWWNHDMVFTKWILSWLKSLRYFVSLRTVVHCND